MATLRLTRGDSPTYRIGPVQRLDENDVLQDVDLTDATSLMTVRKRLGAAVEFTVVGTLDVVNAFVLVQPLTTDSEDMTPGNYVYDVEVTESDGTVTTFPEKGWGKLVLQPDVSHA